MTIGFVRGFRFVLGFRSGEIGSSSVEELLYLDSGEAAGLVDANVRVILYLDSWLWVERLWSYLDRNELI